MRMPPSRMWTEISGGDGDERHTDDEANQRGDEPVQRSDPVDSQGSREGERGGGITRGARGREHEDGEEGARTSLATTMSSSPHVHSPGPCPTRTHKDLRGTLSDPKMHEGAQGKRKARSREGLRG